MDIAGLPAELRVVAHVVLALALVVAVLLIKHRKHLTYATLTFLINIFRVYALAFVATCEWWCVVMC